MSSDVEREAPVIESIDQLIDLFRAGEKPRAQWRVGTEHEKAPFYLDSLRPVPFEGGVRSLLEALAERGWQGDYNQGNLVALRRGQASVTLEPGGQIELSGAPLVSMTDTARELDAHLAEVTEVAARMGVGLSTLGCRPLEAVEDMVWMPRKRHELMRAYLPTRGRLALDMMVSSCTTQANFDYASERDMADKMRVAMAVSPVAAAIFANSPYHRGVFSGQRSVRYAMWNDVDPDRCGLLPFVFADDFGYREYIEYTMDVPMLFVRRQGDYLPATGMTMRQFVARGFDGSAATVADYENHLSGMFPEIRLKTFLEVRSADVGPREHILALTAFWKGLLYDDEARHDAWTLLAPLTFGERLAMQRTAAIEGLRGHGPRFSLLELAQDLLRWAKGGLERQGEDPTYLAGIEPIVATGVTRADALLERYGEGPLEGPLARAILLDNAF